MIPILVCRPTEQVAFLAAPFPTDVSKYWYSDRHYVTVQFNDVSIWNTLVYQFPIVCSVT